MAYNNNNDVRQFELSQPPSDGISNLVYSKSGLLLVSSWDSKVRIYDVVNNSLRSQYQHKAAVLDCDFLDETKALSSSLDKTVKLFDMTTSQDETIGSHEGAVRCVKYSSSTNAIFSGSWDKTLMMWDWRSNRCQATANLGHKVFTMSVVENLLVVGTSERKVIIYDLRNGISEYEQCRESSLKYQTRCIRLFPDTSGYALSSIDGRVAIEYIDPSSESQKLKYAFKCHRDTKDQSTSVGSSSASQEKIDIVYPVNVIEFHPSYGTFATGGCDGKVNIWDGKNKKRICQFPPYKTSISALAFNNDGSQLAIAASYTYEEGEKDHEPDAIWIRNINEAEIKPKPRAPLNA